MQRYFDYLSSGTIAEGGKIIINLIPAKLECLECKCTFEADIRQKKLPCPNCGSNNNKLISGNEFLIDSIGVI